MYSMKFILNELRSKKLAYGLDLLLLYRAEF